MNFLKKYGALLVGPFLLVLLFTIPNSLNTDQRLFLGVFGITVYLWLFTNIPLYISGLLSVSVSIGLGLGPANDIFANFAHPIIFLFLGGFLLAEAFHKVGLDRRISLFLLTRSFIKGSLTRLLFALMFLTATFTMWISNTATTAMMLPLVLGVMNGLEIKDKKITSVILLCIAYSSSIGGIATPIGSTPNIIALGMLDEFSGLKISFLEWMLYTLPMATVFLGCLFLLSTYQFKNYKFKMNIEFLQKEYQELPRISKHEKATFIVFLLTVSLWLLPSFLKLLSLKIPVQLNPGAVAVFGATLLFLMPFNDENKLLKPKAIKNIDWSSLLLFGSGLALGKLLFNLGLAEMAGKSLQNMVAGLPLILILLTIFVVVIFSTELTSNTATANILLPIIISLASQMQLNPLFLAMGVSISCSMAFMLPVATPPNAIVYGSEKVDKKDMIKLGLGLNIIIALLLSMFIFCYSTFL